MTDLKPTPAQFRAYLLAHDWEHRHNGLDGHEHWWHPATADYTDESYSWPPDDPDPIGGGMIEVIADKEGRCEHEVLADMLGEMDTATALARVAELEAERDDLAHLYAELAAERDGHRRRQIEAERALMLMLIREGGRAEFTPKEMVRAPGDGSFVSSRDVATGNEVIEFRATQRVPMPVPVPATCVCGCDPRPSACRCRDVECDCAPDCPICDTDEGA
jgi:hypothetical protein